MLRVAYARIRPLADDELGLLPETERTRQFGSGRRRLEFLNGRLLLRRQLQAATSRPAASHRIDIRAGGKPHCVDGPAISISHAGDWVACCTTDQPLVGIDIETADHHRRGARIAERFFAPAESEWLAGQEPSRFVMLWVLKEAQLKALGRSIFDGMNTLPCLVEPPEIRRLGGPGATESLRLYAVEDFYLGLAAPGPLGVESAIETWNVGAGRFEDSAAAEFVAATA